MTFTTMSFLRASIRAGSSRQFSSCAVRCSRQRSVVVELIEDVPSLGVKFDRVQVTPGRMRHELFPRKLAHYIPWKRSSDRQVYRFVPSPSDAPQIAETSEATADAHEVSVTPQELLDKLYLAPEELVFERRTVSPELKQLHGSLTLSDVMEKLDLPKGEYSVSWVGDVDGGAKLSGAGRVKQLGERKVKLQVKGRGEESVEILVRIVREEDAHDA